MNRYKKQGWFGESYRHYLASKGVLTARPLRRSVNQSPVYKFNPERIDVDDYAIYDDLRQPLKSTPERTRKSRTSAYIWPEHIASEQQQKIRSEPVQSVESVRERIIPIPVPFQQTVFVPYSQQTSDVDRLRRAYIEESVLREEYGDVVDILPSHVRENLLRSMGFR